MANKEADFIIQNGILVKTKGQNAVTLRKNLANRTNITDIAPIYTSKKKKKEEDENETLDFFNSGAFGRDDINVVEKSVLGVGSTLLDATTNVARGILTPIEGLFDFARHGIADVTEFVGAKETAQEIRDIANKSDMDTLFGWTDDYFDKNSMLGRTSESTAQGLGQVASMMIPAGIGQAVGLGAKGVTALTSGWTGVSSMGSGRSEAYLGGATDDEARTYGLINGVVEAGTELLFGGLGKTIGAVGYSSGISSADDMLAKNLSNKLTNVLSKNLKVSGNTLNIAGNTVELGVKASAEGLEEVIAGLGNALGKKFTYMSEEELGEIIEDENLLESFVVGALTSGIAQSGVVPTMREGSYIEANRQGTDFITGYTQNEQKVVDKEIENRIKEAEKDGKKLDKKERAEIEKEVKQELEKGYISIDSIERTLGSESYAEYDNLVKESEEFETLRNTKAGELTDVQNDRLQELKQKNSEKSYKDLLAETKKKISDDVMSLVKDDRFIQESYNEKAKKSEVFEADLTKYDAKQQEVVKKATESGILNNTRRTHEFVDMIAKISADKGVSFDFTNNEKLANSKFALEGKTISGYVENGNVTLNIDSSKALNTIVGHEITHVMEGTELYTELQKAVKDYAITKGDYATRLDSIKKHYEGVEGANVENEITADLVGDYLFTDPDFISKLSVDKPTLFQKIYDEIKYLVKVVTGSKEARQLEKVKRAFEKAYKESSNIQEGTRYTLDEAPAVDTQGRTLTKEQQEKFKDSKVRDENGQLKVMYHGTTEQFTVFDKKKSKSSGLYGRGFYFTDSKGHAGQYGTQLEVYLDIKNPVKTGTNEISKEQMRKFVNEIAENEDYGIENYGYGATVDSVTDSVYGKTDFEMLMDLNVATIGNMVEAIELFNEVNGTNYDGLIVPTETVAFYPEQIKNTTNEKPTDDPDIRYDLGNEGKKTGKYNVYGKDVALEKPKATEEVAPAENTQEALEENSTVPTSKENLQESKENLYEDDYAPMTEQEANDFVNSDEEWERIRSLQEANEEAEIEAPIQSQLEANSPFDERDIKEVGKRNVNAYMYENPEVKPFFQEEAQIMLGELRNTIKGERVVNAQVLYDTNGEAGVWGTKRETSDELAYLLDEFKYSYKDLEKGLNAIIEDNGKENNAISKRIEFMLDERLRLGHTDFMSGYEVPPNQEYVDTLVEKEISEYSDEAWNQWLSQVEQERNAEMQETVEDVAPVDDMQVLYSLEQEQQSIIEEMDNVVETEEATDVLENPTQENYNSKVENYQKAIEGYRNVRATVETAFDETIAKKTAEYEALKRKDTQRATNLLTQIENLKLRKNNNLLKVDQKIQRAEKNVDNLIHSGATRRAVLHNNLVEDMRGTFAQHGMDFDKILENAKNKGTFASVDNTPQRFMEKTLGYKEGRLLADLTVNEVAQNESKGINWLNSFTNKKDGLLRQISKQYNIKPRSKESALAQMYAEGFWVNEENQLVAYGDAELEADVKDPQVRENIKGLAKDTRIRRIYDETLDMINDSRRRNLYEAIPKRQNYFLHFREMEDTFSKLGIPFNPNDIRLKDLPTDINGMTADLQPGQPYFASANQRKGFKTTYDLLGGVEKYLNNAKNQIYHIDDIQKLRALRNYIADTFGQAKGLESLNAMTEEEAMQRIEEVYNSHLSTFAKFLNEEANVIAGKTALVDRGLEGIVGRRGIQFLNTVNRQVGSNMVGFNISSSLTNLISVTQALAKSNKADFVKAFTQTVSNRISSVFGKDDGFRQVNPIFARRNGIEKFSNTLWDKATDKGYIFMGAVDNISTEIIARTKYNEFIKKGMSEQKAHIEADKWASRLLGDRSLGQQPQVFNSKMLGMFTKFQLEVRNQLDSQFYDTIQETKVSNEDIENALVRNAKTSAKVTSTFVQLAVAQHLFGMAFESIAGYNPAFDIVSTLIKLFGFDDDEESEDTALDNIEQGFLELLGDLPYTSMVTSGGRIPISSALPIKQFVTGEDSYGGEKSRLDTLKESAPYFLMPTGYGQLKKTTQGLGMFDDDLPIAGSYTKSGNLRFSVEDNLKNRIKAGFFGQYASEEASDYFDNERQTLKQNQIQELVDLDMPIKDYWEYRDGLKKQETLEDKFEYIAGLDLPVRQKNIMINNVVDRKEKVDLTNYNDFESYEEFDWYTKNQEKYSFFEENGVSYAEYKADEDTKEEYDSIYEWYKNYPEKVAVAKTVTDNVIEYRRYISDISDLTADKTTNGKTISGSRKNKVINYVNSLNLSVPQKAILIRQEYSTFRDYNNEIVNYVWDLDVSYSEKVSILEELEIYVDSNGNVTWK